MPVGYSTRCKVCNHPRREEIEKWHLEEGIAYREIERRLNGKITNPAIRRHFLEHCNVKEEAAIRYRAAQEQFEQVVTKRVSDLERLDDSIDRAHRLSAAAEEQISEILQNKAKLPKTLVDIYAAASTELRQTVKVKLELLGEDPSTRLADALAELWNVDSE